MAKMNYVAQILGFKIVARCSDKASGAFLLKMGASRKLFDRSRIEIDAGSKEALARALNSLRDAGFLFAGGPAGWPPASVYEDLRDEGLVDGTIRVITWRSKGIPVIEDGI